MPAMHLDEKKKGDVKMKQVSKVGDQKQMRELSDNYVMGCRHGQPLSGISHVVI